MYIFEQCELDKLLELARRAGRLTNQQTIELLVSFTENELADKFILPMMNRYYVTHPSVIARYARQKKAIPMPRKDLTDLLNGIEALYMAKYENPAVNDLLHRFHRKLKEKLEET
jgi:hypothetical protein